MHTVIPVIKVTRNCFQQIKRTSIPYPPMGRYCFIGKSADLLVGGHSQVLQSLGHVGQTLLKRQHDLRLQCVTHQQLLMLTTSSSQE